MKKIIALAVLLLMTAGITMAAPKKKAEKKVVTTVFVTDVDCHHCAQKIYNTIAYEKGVKDLKVDVPTKQVTITYDAAKQTPETLTAALANIKVKVVKVAQ